jgi:hypothetical protein
LCACACSCLVPRREGPPPERARQSEVRGFFWAPYLASRQLPDSCPSAQAWRGASPCHRALVLVPSCLSLPLFVRNLWSSTLLPLTSLSPSLSLSVLRDSPAPQKSITSIDPSHYVFGPLFGCPKHHPTQLFSLTPTAHMLVAWKFDQQRPPRNVFVETGC